MSVVDVVKYDGTPDVFAWKYPKQDLGTWTQLIVNESQEAVLFKGGIACDVFQAGRHTLSTANIPLLNKIVNLPFGGESPFSAEVWYVNKLHALDIKWGTPTPIQIQDPKYKIMIPLRSYGQFGIQIEDAKKFLIKLVGTLPRFDKNHLSQYFRGVYLTKVKDAISTYLVVEKVSALEINVYLEEISAHLKERMQDVFSEYGISLVKFYVNDISFPEDDPAVRQLKQALAKKAEMDIVGYSYQQERTFDTLEGAATNPGSMQAGLMGAGVGMGIGMGVGGVFGQQFSSLTQQLNVNDTRPCPNCKAAMDKMARFCGMCGFDTANSEVAAAKEIQCASCQCRLGENSKFCPQCGKKYIPCPHCRADMEEGAKACPVCRTEVVPPCPQCGTGLAPNSKFCSQCGYAFLKKCGQCGHEMTGEPKFCSECGTKLS